MFNFCKKKQLLLLVLFCLALAPAFSQNAYYDTRILLDNKLVGDDGRLKKSVEVYAILDRYINPSVKDEISDIELRIDPNDNSLGNPFLNYKSGSQSIITDYVASATKSVNNIGALEVPPALLEATTDFLKERVQEELVLTFVDKFRSEFNRYPELVYLLPNTKALLESQNMLSTPSFGQTWKATFLLDLDNLLDNTEVLIHALPKYHELEARQSFKAFLIAARAVKFHQQGLSTPEILLNLDGRYGVDAKADTIGKTLSLLALLSENVRSQEKDQNYISTSQFRSLGVNGFRIFLGLIYERNRGLFDIKVGTSNGSNEITLLTLLNTALTPNQSSFGKAAPFHALILSLLQNGELINQRSKSIEKLASLSDPVQRRRKIAEEMIESLALTEQIIEQAITVYYIDKPDSYYQSSYYVTWRPILKATVEVGRALESRNYGSVIASAMPVLNQLVQDRLGQIKDGKADSTKKLTNFLKVYNYYGSFMVDVTNADSAPAIKAVIKKYALPVSSYRAKRVNQFTAELGAFPGLFGALEHSISVGSAKSERSFTSGVTAPIGLSFSWRACSKRPSGCWGIFLPIVDIGAPLAYRWNNQSGFPEKVLISQIFSPGFYLIHGFRNTPLSLAFGGQFAPKLRTITTDGSGLQANAFRIGLTLSVDIPIFRLASKE